MSHFIVRGMLIKAKKYSLNIEVQFVANQIDVPPADKGSGTYHAMDSDDFHHDRTLSVKIVVTDRRQLRMLFRLGDD